MTTKPKTTRFNIARVERPTAPPAGQPEMPFDNQEDGFGNQDFRPAPPVAPAASTPSENPDEVALAAIASEGLTGRQLRRARLLAQRHGLVIGSDLDAVLQLRRAGIDPFARASMLDVVAAPSPATAPAAATPGRELARLPGDVVQLPQRAKPLNLPSTEQRAEVNQAAEILRMQQEIARRRRRKLALLMARLIAFVFLPTFLAGWYYYNVATPMYATRAEFQIQQAGPASSGGALGGLFSGTALATAPDSIAVQGYLQSPGAMIRLDQDIGFRAHFQGDEIDAFQRLAPDASQQSAYRIYKKFVKISFDPNEGIVRMEVIAADPKLAAAWAEQLIKYAEEQIDHLTQRLREDQMRDAQTGYDKAQADLTASQRKLIDLQEKFKVLSSETEVGLITAQISTLEGQLTQERLSLAQMEANENPNAARMEPVKRRIETLEAEVASLRARLTEGSDGETSLAQVQAELLVAQADLQTRQLILAQSLQSMETARVEANRQVRYLSMSVTPTISDEAAYPRAFENTMVAMLILLGIYLMVSMTAAILREQVSA